MQPSRQGTASEPLKLVGRIWQVIITNLGALVPNLPSPRPRVFPLPGPAFKPATFQSSLSDRLCSNHYFYNNNNNRCCCSHYRVHFMPGDAELLTDTQPGTDCYGVLITLCLLTVRNPQDVSPRSEPDSRT